MSIDEGIRERLSIIKMLLVLVCTSYHLGAFDEIVVLSQLVPSRIPVVLDKGSSF